MYVNNKYGTTKGSSEIDFAHEDLDGNLQIYEIKLNNPSAGIVRSRKTSNVHFFIPVF